VAITEGPEGRSLGTAAAADPTVAARRALNEAILEEVPLLTAVGKTNVNITDEEIQCRYRTSILQDQDSVFRSESRRPERGFPRAIDRSFAELTHTEVGVFVVRALINERNEIESAPRNA